MPDEEKILHSTINIVNNNAIPPIELYRGEALFVLGGNGTGKSSLVQNAVGQISPWTYLSGSRPVVFENESINMSVRTRLSLVNNIMHWDRQPQSRWQPVHGYSRNEKTIFDLLSKEVGYKVEAAERIVIEGRNCDAIDLLTQKKSPLDRLNAILLQSTLPIQIVVKNSELYAERNGAQYSIARMSDGERAALLMAADIFTAEDNTLFILDEPERHLHRSIIIPFLSLLIKERSDCAFIISTHDLDLPSQVGNSKIVLVRECTWVDNTVVSWDIDLLSPSDNLPESILKDVLGSRRKILFIEGKNSSLDLPFYSSVFENISVLAKEGCRNVIGAIEGLRGAENLHRVTPIGLIDNDGMSAQVIADLESKDIFALPVYSVESLYYSEKSIDFVSRRQADTFKVNAADLKRAAEIGALAEFSKASTQEHLASRRSERLVRDNIRDQTPSKNHIAANPQITISVTSPYANYLREIQDNVANAKIYDIISRFPVRESGALQSIASALKFRSVADYEKAVLALLNSDTEFKDEIRNIINKITSRIESV